MKHRWWHWWFTYNLSVPYKIVDTWHGTSVIYRDTYCGICNKVVSKNYEEKE